MISSPVVHNGIYITEISFTCQTRCKESRRPRTVGTLIDNFEHIIIQIDGPTFSNLQNRSLTFYKVQTTHCYRHLTTSYKLRRITSATHIFTTGWMPFGYCKTSFHFFFRNFPERLHYRLAVTCLPTCSVKRTRTGINKMNKTIRSLAFQSLSRYTFHCIRTPISTYICKYLRRIRQEMIEQHGSTV